MMSVSADAILSEGTGRSEYHLWWSRRALWPALVSVRVCRTGRSRTVARSTFPVNAPALTLKRD